ncbi:outer membrane protein assembly factor BamA [Rhodoblastus sphagnicola]|uniref:Outer membrane protein assembly factor BamA n=1 Tax=Rhodoblastus sphagnicola TaxID=333368 RepID=A0A2S6N8C0_9HYPH|nr:outer membrane protein assembly factor BamA [Rhodoblastus sphagnicola]MBB4198176.1 outer membrane protein insertion porin family [Rhodoblastus sphagnicola]PPQ30866.1 outer membrane protein assembly factor BamA [Rhodoblastus sphagnicola]
MKFRQALLGRSAQAAILVAGLVASSAAMAESIIVQGNSRVDSETIRSYFIGGDANEGVKKLYETGYFSDVKINRSGGTLVVRVVENSQQINHVVFVGNSKVKAEDLEKETRLHSGGAFSEAAAQTDVQRIADVYRRAGRSAAKISYRTVSVPNGTVDVVYDIQEGDKTGVKEIRFQGNHAYSSSKLIGMMETTEMNYLSWLKSSDVYDPDRIAKDAEVIRRYYLKNGYADFHVIGVDATFDPSAGGYIVTISVEEGLPYTVSSATVESHLRGVDASALEPDLRIHTGDLYNGDQVDKTVEAMTREVGRRGYAFTNIRPRGDRDPVNHTVALAFVVEDGPRVYVERINIHGNTTTRDYVIRREFDLGEGDAYNKTLVDKAEKRLNALGFFKKVKIANEQGTAADRVVLDVDVEEQSTGSFSVSGGYSTTEGFLAEVSVSQSNFLGRGEYIRTAVSVGQYSKGIELNYTEPFFLDQRLAAGFDAYSKVTEASSWQYYNNWVTGGTLRLGVPITDEITFSPRYTAYVSRLSIPNSSNMLYNDCSSSASSKYNQDRNNPGVYTDPNGSSDSNQSSCLSNGEASLALKQAAGNWVTSMVGYTLSYTDLDNYRDPHQGISANLKQDFAGVGGDSKFIRTTGDVRYYHELYFDNVVGIARVQGGNITGWGKEPLRVVDNFNLGNSLVRGFAPGGIGPRDMSNTVGGNSGNALGGTNYYGGSLEVQSPIWGIPKDIGLKLAVFADAGNLQGYKGVTNFGSYLGLGSGAVCVPARTGTVNGYKNQQTTQGSCINTQGSDNGLIRSSVGVGLIWASPMGPIRFNYAFATSKSSTDVLQQFSFSGGTSF